MVQTTTVQKTNVPQGTDYFIATQLLNDSIDVDERSAMITYSIKADKLPTGKVATDVRLEMDTSTIPPQVAVANGKKVFYQNSQGSQGWVQIGKNHPAMLANETKDFKVDIKTGFFAALAAGQQLPGGQPNGKTMAQTIDTNTGVFKSAAANQVKLKLRIQFRLEDIKPPPPPPELHDLEEMVFVIKD